MRGRDRGQATVLWAAVLLLAGMLLIPTGRLIGAAAERAAAQTVADVTALGAAAASDGERRSVAATVVAANDARLESLSIHPADDGIEVSVTVVVGDHRASARARRETTWTPPAGEPDRWEPG